MVSMVRASLLLAIAGAACAAPGFAKDKPSKPRPQLELQPITASNLLAPAEPLTVTRNPRLGIIDIERSGLLEAPPYRLEREGDAVTGRRARLSIAVGRTRLFAVSGKLSRRERPGPPDALDGSRSNPLGSRKLESGRIYGGGVERTLGPMDFSAGYQFSRINGAELDPTGDSAAMRIDDSAQSHSVQLSARVRF